MITLFENGDLVVRYLTIRKKGSHTASTMFIFVGQSAEEVPSENPILCDKVVRLDRKGKAETYEGLVDFSGGFDQDVIGTSYHIGLSDASQMRFEYFEEYRAFLEKVGKATPKEHGNTQLFQKYE